MRIAIRLMPPLRGANSISQQNPLPPDACNAYANVLFVVA